MTLCCRQPVDSLTPGFQNPATHCTPSLELRLRPRRLISLTEKIENKKMESNAELKQRFNEFVVKDADLGRQV